VWVDEFNFDLTNAMAQDMLSSALGFAQLGTQIQAKVIGPREHVKSTDSE